MLSIVKTVKGIYVEEKTFTDDLEGYAEAQIKIICDNEVAESSTICMLPDIHPGKIAPIELSMMVTDKMILQLLGVDIGCGMTCVRLNKNNAEFQKLDSVIKENTLLGVVIRREPHHMGQNFPTKNFNVSMTADSLKICNNPVLENMDTEKIFVKHKLVLLYWIQDNTVIVDRMFHELQDYEEIFAEELHLQ